MLFGREAPVGQGTAAPVRSWLSWLLPVAVAVGLLGLHAADWWFYVADDAFISLRYADRLLAGQGLTWTAGPPVEGYSNLLWVLLTALVGLPGLDLVLAMRLVGLATGLGTAAVLAGSLSRHSALGGLLAGLALAASTSMALWIPGGLEQPLVALLVAVALVGLGRGLRADAGPPSSRTVLVPALALALLCWTRPDSPLLVACLCLGWFLATGQDRAALRSGAVLAAVPAGATVLQLLFRLAYYGDHLPNTAHVKLRPSEAHTDMGALWTAQALDAHLPLLGLALLAVLWSPRGEPARARLRLALPVLGGWLAWTVTIGGDIFPAFRHFVPVVVVLAWLAGSGLAGLAQRRRGAAVAVLVLGAGALGWMTHDQRRHPNVVRAHTEAWVIDGRDVGALLREAFAEEQPVVALSPAGSIPYESRLPCLDMIGLNDRHIGRSESDGHGWIGHETGDGTYVYAQQPDIVFFTGPRGGTHPSFASEKQLDALPEFHEDHALVRWRTVARYAPEPVVLQPWVRRQGRVGFRQDSDLLRVPAGLLTELGGTAEPGPDGRLVLPLGEGESAGVVLPAGDWEVVEQPGLRADIVGGDRGLELRVVATEEVKVEEVRLRKRPTPPP